MDYEGSLAFLGDLEEVLRKGGTWLADKKPIKSIRDWAINFSLWPVHLTTACCGCEFAAAAGPRFDMERLGILPWVGSRQTNVLVIEGTLTRKMAKAARIVYRQMPEPKFVIAMGSCASDGGIFWNSYNIVKVKDVLPVDVYIPGCPPRPEAILRAFMEIKEKNKEKLRYHEEED
ncbi:NADH dehydrogenase [candidate division MSBL1 archaeon SCGC-AAA261O19]|uniref:NADH dehydrogenase n=1 Tax=candidate division MSBL1 archaeon SCGC-AAA261O19 TaxID=1698277 RepID=A0A133VEK8_9EURY|nr:NADH dehydrogenase [candidate division MSBL1 archaeon SCGC-AAA261O19]